MRGTRSAQTRDERARERSRAEHSEARERTRAVCTSARTNKENTRATPPYIRIGLRGAANEGVGNARMNNLSQLHTSTCVFQNVHLSNFVLVQIFSKCLRKNGLDISKFIVTSD